MKKLQLATLALPLLYLPASFAEIQLNGFASVRATQVDSDNGGKPFSFFDEDGELSFRHESLFALQARADLGEGLSATVQLFADGKSDFDVEARWAYISYQINDTHQLNAGRLANPIFHQSEYEKVGYAHRFSRLPLSVYTNFDFSTVEGISLNSNFEIADGDYNLETKLLYGNWDGDVFITAVNSRVPLGFNNLFSLNATLSGDWWKVFAGIFITEMDAAIFDNAVIGAAIQPGLDFALATGASQNDVNAFVDATTWDEKDGIYWFTGFGVDYNDWLIDFEYANYGVDDSSDAFSENWFLAVGRRFDQFVITVHREEAEQPDDYGFLGNVTHPVLNATGTAFHDGLNAPEYEGYGITLKYDFHPSAAFKVDYFMGEHSIASIGDYTIISAGIDLVF